MICEECGLPAASVLLCGIEQLELWLKRFPDAARIADIDPIDSPLIVSPDDLAVVVEHLADRLKTLDPSGGAPPSDRVSYARKNALNNMSEEYAHELRRRYLKDTLQIKNFLAAPENDDVLRRYQSATDEFQLQVLAKRRDHRSFDEVLNYLINLVLARDPILRAHKRLTRTMIFYMYWHCDLGVNDDAAT